MGTMHAGRIETSKRMQELLAFLKERGSAGATGLEIAARLNCLNSATEVSALRKRLRESGQGAIDCERERVTERNAVVYRYRLVIDVPAKVAKAGELFA